MNKFIAGLAVMLTTVVMLYLVMVSMSETQAKYDIIYQECGGSYCTTEEK